MVLQFFIEFLKNPRQLSTFTPTGNEVGKKMASLAEVENAKVIVELGAAHGNVTRHILKRMSKNARLYSIEINKGLFEELRKIKDKRFVPIYGDASAVDSILKKYCLNKADCIISTLPLVTIPKEVEKKIISNSKKILDGPFVQIRYSTLYEGQLKAQFSEVSRHFVSNNLPPVFVYRCFK